MPTAAHLRQQIEASLAARIPSALTPPPRVIRPTAPTGIAALDEALNGGLPIGAITELTGPECSGRTSLALSFIARLTKDNRVCAWVDVSDALHPESADASGIDLNHLLWIRCGPPAVQLPLPGIDDFSFRPDPEFAQASKAGAEEPAVQVARSRVPHIPAVGMWESRAARSGSAAVITSAPPIRHDYLAPRCCEPMPKVRRHSRETLPQPPTRNQKLETRNPKPDPHPAPSTLYPRKKPYSRLDQALRATDLLLQGGGFSAIVLDLGGIAPEFALRVPLATWFRYRAAAERTHASVLLLTQHPCSKSSAGLVLHCQPSQADPDATTVLTGAEYRIEIARDRFTRPTNLVDFNSRKPPQSDHTILWNTRTPWSTIHPGKSGRP